MTFCTLLLCDIAKRGNSLFFSFFFSEAYFVLFRGVDHQWDGGHFATAGAQVDIWNHNRFSSQLGYDCFNPMCDLFQ